MLRACARVLRPGGRLAFFTIHPAPGLDRAGRRRAARAGPPAVTVRGDHRRMLERAGFADVEEVDVTDAYLTAARRWLAGTVAHADELRAADPDDYDQRLIDRRTTVAAIEDGVLRRTRYTARRRVAAR